MRRLGAMAACAMLGLGCGGEGGPADASPPTDAAGPTDGGTEVDALHVSTTLAHSCNTTAPGWCAWNARCGADSGLCTTARDSECCAAAGLEPALCGCISAGDYRDVEPCLMELQADGGTCEMPAACADLLEVRHCGFDAGL